VSISIGARRRIFAFERGSLVDHRSTQWQNHAQHVDLSNPCLDTHMPAGAKGTITQSTFTPPVNGGSEMIATADMKYLGPCPAGIEAGDVILPNGTITHAKH
jgi:hypothetical protein